MLTLAGAAKALTYSSRRPRIRALIANIDAGTLTASERNEALKLVLLDLPGE